MELIAGIRSDLADLVALLGARQQSRRPLGVDNLVTADEIREEVGWGEERLKEWLRAQPIRRYPGRRTVQYRWGDVLAYLPAVEPSGVRAANDSLIAPPPPPAANFARR